MLALQRDHQTVVQQFGLQRPKVTHLARSFVYMRSAHRKLQFAHLWWLKGKNIDTHLVVSLFIWFPFHSCLSSTGTVIHRHARIATPQRSCCSTEPRTARNKNFVRGNVVSLHPRKLYPLRRTLLHRPAAFGGKKYYISLSVTDCRCSAAYYLS